MAEWPEESPRSPQVKRYELTEEELYNIWVAGRYATHLGFKDHLSTLTPLPEPDQDVNYSKLIGEWAGSQGFDEFVLDHATVMDNLGKWITRRISRGGWRISVDWAGPGAKDFSPPTHPPKTRRE